MPLNRVLDSASVAQMEADLALAEQEAERLTEENARLRAALYLALCDHQPCCEGVAKALELLSFNIGAEKSCAPGS